jgi:hypothetical protein
MPSSRFLISSQTLGSAAATVTFSSIPATYTDLVLRISNRSTAAGTVLASALIFNSSSTANYSSTILEGNGTSGSSFRMTSDTQAYTYDINAADSTSNTFSSGEIYVPNYAGTVAKPFGVFGTSENNDAFSRIRASANLWGLTDAITSITIQMYGGSNFATGSSFYLYGIKNS